MSNPQGKPYGLRIKEAIARGSAAGLRLRERRRRAGKRASDGGQYGTLPRILHDQLVRRYGAQYPQDETLMRDLRQRHPEMMAADGDVPGDAADGVHTTRGTVSMKWRQGAWWRPTRDGGWERFNPPSKMNWGKDPPPTIL